MQIWGLKHRIWALETSGALWGKWNINVTPIPRAFHVGFVIYALVCITGFRPDSTFQVWNWLWRYLSSILSSSSSSLHESPSFPMSPSYFYICICAVVYSSIDSKIHKWDKTFDICLSTSGLFDWLWQSHIAFNSQRIKQFPCSLGLNKFHFLHPFTCWQISWLIL